MIGCETARRLMDLRLDGEIGADDAVALEVHLRACPACAEVATGLEGVTAGLLQIPFEELPEADLEAVLDRTVRADGRAGERASERADEGVGLRRDARFRAFRFEPFASRLTRHMRAHAAGYALVAAAVLAAVAIIPLTYRPSAPPEPTAAQVEQAAQEARMVLALASKAVRSAESTARDRVIAREVTPALRHVPVRWGRIPSSRRNGV